MYIKRLPIDTLLELVFVGVGFLDIVILVIRMVDKVSKKKKNSKFHVNNKNIFV